MKVTIAIVFLTLAVFFSQAFPTQEKINNEGISTLLKPLEELPQNEQKTLKINEDDVVHRRIARAANPQVGHFVNYIRPNDRFPTVA